STDAERAIIHDATAQAGADPIGASTGTAAAVAAFGLVENQRAGRDGSATTVIDAATLPGVNGGARAADTAVATEGLVAAEPAVADEERRGQGHIINAAAPAVAAAGADSLVANEQALAEEQESAGLIADSAAPAVTAAVSALGSVTGQDDVGEGQAAAVVQDASAHVGKSVSDCQIVDDHPIAAADLEDPAAVVAAYGQEIGTRAMDSYAVGDVQLAAGQGDGAKQAGGEAD